ncbi:hypothetical protein GCM10010193_03480 [Kitasatospora atroaurantiaca]|uniref:Uncharacterized protein n=1 Tax=Kitasatospora atroaurantiaca TaxID=285545 RepID=A0A561ELS1_9ACTN|nr:hypothetical protein [Kitasatospora atroaurantiaca]TWE16567.1 hypothetical protein FB465_1550 [Kitasatospora atroaurantiaca]
MFELLPGVGVVLPDGAGTLRFGMDGDTTRETLARLGQVRVEGALDEAWTCTVQWGDLELTAGADGIDRSDPLLANVVLSRAWHPRRPTVGRGTRPPAWHGPAGVPVILDDIDLFGYPAAEVLEVLEVLGDGRYPELRLQPAAPGGYLPAVSFRAERRPGPGDRTQAGTDEPDLASYEAMWTTGRDQWQLEQTGSGYLIVMKGERPMYLLICHDTLADQITARMLAAGVEIVDGP